MARPQPGQVHALEPSNADVIALAVQRNPGAAPRHDVPAKFPGPSAVAGSSPLANEQRPAMILLDAFTAISQQLAQFERTANC